MYVLLNLVAFFLLTGYALVLMFSKPSYVKLSKKEKVLLTGREKFLLLTLATGMVSAGGVGATVGINVVALRLMIWMMMILLAFILFRKSHRFNILVLVYLLFIGWMAVSLLWAEDIGFGIRVILKYLYPLLIMLFAATFVRSKYFIFVAMRWMLMVAFIMSLMVGGATTHVLGIWFFHLGGLFWPMATLADHLAIMSGVAYIMWWRTKNNNYLYLIVWFLLSSIFNSVRTGMLGIFIVFTVASYLRYKTYSIPYMAGIAMIAILSVIFIPQVKEKMFYDPNAISSMDDFGGVEQSQINSNGRFAMWEWALNEYYVDNELTGSGIGAIQERLYSGDHPFSVSKIIHNDYVQMLCDTGLTGISLYLLFVLLSGVTAMQYTKKRVPLYLQNTAFLVVTSFAATLTTMMTDNVVNYTFAVHSYPFIFLGIMMAYREIYKRDLKMKKRRRMT